MSLTPKRWVSIGTYLLRIAIGVALACYVFGRNDADLSDLVGPQALSLLSVLLLLEVVVFLLSSIRWVIIARHVASQDLPMGRGIVICWIGQFFSSFLPGMLAADVSRYYYVSRIYPGWKANAATIIWDRIVALMTLTVLGLAGAVAYWRGWPLAAYGLSALAGLTVGVLLLSVRVFQARVAARICAISLCTFSLKAFSLWYILSVLNPGQAGTVVYYLSMMGLIFEAIPLTPANLGVGHYVYDALYGLREGVLGAVVYNYYFVAKLLFKLSGGLGWVCFRPRSR